MTTDDPNSRTNSAQASTSTNSPSTESTPTTTLSTKRESSWPSVLFYIHLNILGLYGITVLFSNCYLTTVLFTTLLTLIGISGVTVGAHRLWAHKSYKATTFLKVILMLSQTMAGQVNL